MELVLELVEGDVLNENAVLGMLITQCIRGLGPFWRNTYAQYVVRSASINNMAFSIEKVFFVER
jgi:hypothetical protein